MGIIITLFVLGTLSITVVGFSLYYGISPMPTSRKVREEMLALIPLNKGVVYELGSGWGNLIFPLAKRFPSLQIIAVEGSWVPWLISALLVKILRYPNLTLQRKNFYSLPLDEADGVICYLYPGAMERLKVKFEKELKKSAFVISNTFALSGWTPVQVKRAKDVWRSPVYFFTAGAMTSPAKNQAITRSKISTPINPAGKPHQFQLGNEPITPTAKPARVTNQTPLQ
ncbi:MAG: hypothetical protein S4CHLAM2_01430 [Chlamydiales bacterium]|nr:hypothetical protein [Chlamydiales bacterium]